MGDEKCQGIGIWCLCEIVSGLDDCGGVTVTNILVVDGTKCPALGLRAEEMLTEWRALGIDLSYFGTLVWDLI